MEKDSRAQVKMLLAKKYHITLTELAKRLSEKTGKHYSRQNLSGRLALNSLKYSEMVNICEILGYDIRFVEK